MLRKRPINSTYLFRPARWICYGVFVITLASGLPSTAASYVIPYQAARSNGLQRAWFAQIGVDRTRSRVTDWVLHNSQLYALTSAGTIHTLDSRTGETVWVSHVGTPDHPAAGPAVNDNYVVVLSSSRLYVLDRGDGHLIWSRRLGGATGTAAALSDTHVYVPLLGGRMEGYLLEDPTTATWQFQSIGHIFQRPLTTGEYVTWSTDRGYLYVGDTNQPRVLFRAETNDEIVAAPVSLGTNIYATSLSGYLYCYNEPNGEELWRYATGYPISRPPAVIGDRAYVASEEPALYAVDSTSGTHLWAAAGPVQFVAQGADRIYALDRFGALLVLDGESGSIAGRIPTAEGVFALVNDQSDRIFLVSDSGFVQCLHEAGAVEPTLYRETESAEEAPTEEAEESPAADESAEESTSEPIEEEPAEEEGDVFGDDDNPFG